MKHIFLKIFLLLLLFRPTTALSEKLIPDPSSGKIEIVCGMNDEGKRNMCNLKDHQCYKCHEWYCDPWLCITQTHKEVFYCATSSPGSHCDHAKDGGLTGETYRKVIGLIDLKHKYGKECIAVNLYAKYSACYGCIIVETLIEAFIKAAAQAYEVSRSAANAVALVCMMIWIAFFVFKNVTAFTSVEPMKLLQEFFVQCFKVVLVLIIINSGMTTILHYTLVPILQAGIDMANSISAAGNNLTAEFTNGGQK